MGRRGPQKQNDAETAYLLKMPAELDRRVRAAAKREGVTLAEWWRNAAQAAVDAATKERG